MTAKKDSKSAAQRRADKEQGGEREFEVSGSMSVHPAGENPAAESQPASGGSGYSRGGRAGTDPAGDLEGRPSRRAEDERAGSRYPDGAEGEPGQAQPLEGLPGSAAITGEAPNAAWPALAERTTAHRLLVTAAGDEADAGAELTGATPYANWLEPREGPNGTTWLVTVGEADLDNFLAQCDQVGASVQELEGDGSVLRHVQGDESAGWTHPADRDPEAEAAARAEGERARDEDEADEEDGEKNRDRADSPQKD